MERTSICGLGQVALGPLLSIPLGNQFPPLYLSPEQRKRRTLEGLALIALARRKR